MSTSSSKGGRVWYWIGGCVLAFVLIATCLCCVLGVGLGGWLWQQYTAYPSDPAELTRIVQAEVVQMRGLDFKQPVELKLMTPDELRQRILQDFEEEWSPKEAHDYALVLSAFDFLDPEAIDLYQLYLDLYSGQVAGFYDPETKELYVISDASQVGVLGRITLAHELTHALQDQYFDLQALGYGEEARDQHDSEYLAGVMSLAEGDASLLQVEYMRTLSPLDFVRLVAEYTRFDFSQLEQAPPVISAGMGFPYDQGQAFAMQLYQQGGWAAVNAAFANPPQSSEHILHGERYWAGDMPRPVALPPLTDTLGSGWRLVDDEDVMGEFTIQLYLAQRLDPDAASQAAQGWGGDRFGVYYHDEQAQLVLAWRTVWDSNAEAGQFLEACKSYMADWAGHTADVAQAGRWCWQSPGNYRCVLEDAGGVSVVRGPDQASVERVLDALAAAPE